MTTNPIVAEAPSTPRVMLMRWLIRGAVGLILTVGLLAAVPFSAALASGEQLPPPTHLASVSERAIAALTGDLREGAPAIHPADFRSRLGYVPVVVDGRPMNPHGGCSSPVSLPERFTDACRVHDFGYDLLRYADVTGRSAGAWARPALDRMLIDDMHAACDDLRCHAAAETARIGLALNTWRQRSGPPRRESGAEIVRTLLTRAVETAIPMTNGGAA